MTSVLEAIILGIIQGITEWLPISSSGHLAITSHFFDLQPDIFFNIFLHFATIFVVFFVFWRDIFKMIKSIIFLDIKSEYFKLAVFLVIATIPVAFVGYFFHDIITSLFSNIFAVGIAFVCTAFIIYLSTRNINTDNLSLANIILIGIAQAFAIIPGISRSGLTISTGLLLGIEKKQLIRFSFLLLIPAVVGALILEIQRVSFNDIMLLPYLFGFFTSLIVGYFSLKLLIRIIYKNKFRYFAYYLFLLGVVVIIFQFF